MKPAVAPPDYRHRAALRRRLGKAFMYLALIAIALTTALPFVWMFFTSLHPRMAQAPTMSTLLRPPKWRFVGWRGVQQSNGPRAIVVMNGPSTTVAWFEKIGGEPVRVPVQSINPASRPADLQRSSNDALRYRLEVKTEGSGEVLIDPPSPDGTYATGTVVRLTAKPDPGWHPDNYSYVFFFPELPMGWFIANSFIVTGGVVLFQLTLCSLAAFAFSRLHWRGRDTLFFLFILIMMIPGQVLVVPLFLIVERLGMINTYWGLIIPAQYLSTAFGTFLLRQFFITIPPSLDEAARLDGCSELGVLWHVILPAARPALATVAAFAFIWTWTDFYWALIVTHSRDMRTLEVGLSVFNESFSGTQYPVRMAAAIIVLLPVLAVFLLLQRYFVRGVVMSGVKG
jgi:multiple sugar transport system permease protein